jgi:hypothetical protein
MTMMTTKKAAKRGKATWKKETRKHSLSGEALKLLNSLLTAIRAGNFLKDSILSLNKQLVWQDINKTQ